MGIAIPPKEEAARDTLLEQFAILDTPLEEESERGGRYPLLKGRH